MQMISTYVGSPMLEVHFDDLAWSALLPEATSGLWIDMVVTRFGVASESPVALAASGGVKLPLVRGYWKG
jgi:hypothetical protein